MDATRSRVHRSLVAGTRCVDSASDYSRDRPGPRRELTAPSNHPSKPVIARSAKLIFITDVTILILTMISSLVGARALGPAGRGDLFVVVVWPPVIAMLAGLGLPTAYRYWMAKEPERVSRLFSNAVIYTMI